LFLILIVTFYFHFLHNINHGKLCARVTYISSTKLTILFVNTRFLWYIYI
jgi:hypothetical protein